MKIRFLAAGLLALAALLGLARPSAAQTGAEGRTPPFTPITKPDYRPSQPPIAPAKGPTALAPVSLFGMNLYLTGLERSLAQADSLGALAAQAGVKWSREELSWANIEPQRKGSFAWATYDTRLGYDAAHGINVVGMLLTTPKWASTNPTAPDWYWWEPSNRQDYYDFVRAAVGPLERPDPYLGNLERAELRRHLELRQSLRSRRGLRRAAPGCVCQHQAGGPHRTGADRRHLCA